MIKKMRQIAGFGADRKFLRNDYGLKRTNKKMFFIPELVEKVEILGMTERKGLRFNGYLISKNLAGEMIYQLKIFYRWDCEKAYLDFRTHFTILNDKVDYLALR